MSPAPDPISTGAPRDVVLHLGMGKSGTSSVQSFLRENRERLGEAGVLFPQAPGRGRHHRLSLLVKDDQELVRSPEWPREKHTDPTRFRRSFRRRLLQEVAASEAPRVLLTDEVLFGRSAPELRRLRRFLDRIGPRPRLVVYLRRQDDHLVSRYQQGVKIGWTARLRDWAREDMSSLYDYSTRLRLLERTLGPSRTVVRRFESGAFVDGSLYQDFLDAAGIDLDVDRLEAVPSRNESLDAESVEFLRLLNIWRVDHGSGSVGQIDNRSLVARLSAGSRGPVLTLPEPVLDRFMEQWRESNRRVALELLGDPSGELFRQPRKSDRISSEQRLDPDRLDHYLAVTELPEEVRLPLRRIAEREARVSDPA